MSIAQHGAQANYLSEEISEQIFGLATATVLLSFTFFIGFFLSRTAGRHPDQYLWLNFFVQLCNKLEENFFLFKKNNNEIEIINTCIAAGDEKSALIAAVLLGDDVRKLNNIDEKNRTPFYISCAKGNINMMAYILFLGFESFSNWNPNKLKFLKLPNKNKQTPLMAAILFHHIELSLHLVRFIRDISPKYAGEYLGINDADDSGKTIFQHINYLLHTIPEGHKSKYFELVELLCECQPSLALPDNNGMNVIHNAIEFGHHEFLAILVKNEKNKEIIHKSLSAPRRAGDTPLHLAARYGQVESLRIILKYIKGESKDQKNIIAALTYKTGYGRTPSEYIFEYPEEEIKEKMLNVLKDFEIYNIINNNQGDAGLDLEQMFEKVSGCPGFYKVKERFQQVNNMSDKISIKR